MNFLKLLLLSSLLDWYRKTYTEDVDDVITPLDELINDIARKLEPDTAPCRKHYFSTEPFRCEKCGCFRP